MPLTFCRVRLLKGCEMGLLPPSWGSSGRRADPGERGWRRYTGRKDMRRTAERTGSRRSFLKGAAAAGLAASAGAFPTVSGGQSKLPIKIGMPTILSGRAAQIGVSSRNAAQMAVDEFNAAGGLDGRVVELINADGCSIILDAEASSAAFAVQEVVRETGHLCIHTVSETSSLSADPKI